MNRGVLRGSATGLFVVGSLLVGLWLRNDTAARAFRSAEIEKLEAARLTTRSIPRPTRSHSKAAWSPATLERGVFGRIEVPRLGISAWIAEGTLPAQLDRGVGHFSTTAFPGRLGNCALAGHRDTFLRGLEDVREHDVIRIDTLQDTYTYEVEWCGVAAPSQVDVLDTTALPSLTVVTCYPFAFVGPALERFVVRARLVESIDDSPATLAIRQEPSQP